MTWLDSLASWLGDPANVSDMVPSVIVMLCTIALIITISVSVRRLGTRIERAIANEAPVRRSPSESRSDRRDRSVRSDRSEPVTGPLRAGNPAPAPAPVAEAAPTPAPAHVNAPAAPLATQPVAPPVAPVAPLTPPPAVGTVAPPLPPSMTSPPPSAQAFARASSLDNDPLNQ